MTEQIIKGWEAIAKFFGVPKIRIVRHRKELFACGAVFHRTEEIPNCRGRRHRVVWTWPSLLKNWTILKAQKGEEI
jgi:hypothetical protein